MSQKICSKNKAWCCRHIEVGEVFSRTSNVCLFFNEVIDNAHSASYTISCNEAAAVQRPYMLCPTTDMDTWYTQEPIRRDGVIASALLKLMHALHVLHSEYKYENVL